MSDKKCAVFGPADYLLCDRMNTQVDNGTLYRRNPDFGVGGRMDLSAVLAVYAGNASEQVDSCPFCGGALRKIETPELRATPPLVTPLEIPDWREVAKIVPPDFINDGSSDPVIVYMLSVFSFIPWCKRALQVINQAGTHHDFGFGPGRLSGSGYSHITRAGWNAMYAQEIADGGHPVIAKDHRWALDKFGTRAWDKWERTMRRWGWHTFQDFMADKDHKYGYGRSAAAKDAVM